MRLPTWLWARMTATVDAVICYYAPLCAVVVVTLASSVPALTLLSVAAGSAICAAAVLALKANGRGLLLSRGSGQTAQSGRSAGLQARIPSERRVSSGFVLLCRRR